MFLQETNYYEILNERQPEDKFLVFIQPPNPHKFFYLYCDHVDSNVTDGACWLRLTRGRDLTIIFEGVVIYYLAFKIENLQMRTKEEVLNLFQKWHEDSKPLVKGIEEMDNSRPLPTMSGLESLAALNGEGKRQRGLYDDSKNYL